MSDDNYLDRTNKELAQTLGEAIWAFSKVERATYRFMKKLSTDTLDVLMADQSIPVRIRVMKLLIARANGPEEIKELARQCVKRIDALAEVRNHIAHNPFQTWIDLDTREFIHEIEKVTDESKVISLSQLKQFSTDAEALAEALNNALSQLRYDR